MDSKSLEREVGFSKLFFAQRQMIESMMTFSDELKRIMTFLRDPLSELPESNPLLNPLDVLLANFAAYHSQARFGLEYKVEPQPEFPTYLHDVTGDISIYFRWNADTEVFIIERRGSKGKLLGFGVSLHKKNFMQEDLDWAEKNGWFWLEE